MDETSVDHIKAEYERLNAAIQREPCISDRRAALYAAQQALAWALEPGRATPPCHYILEGPTIISKEARLLQDAISS
jgi:hypothetical protein